MNREEGFYWVKDTNQEWVISEYYAGKWDLPGQTKELNDDYFLEIDERRIERKGA